MLTQIDVDSENAFYVPILGVTPKDSLLVRSVTGLNPPPINLFIGDYARDGGTYQGRGVQKRNVVITFDLNPNPALGESISGLREMLYKAFFDPQVEADHIKLTLHDDQGRARYLVGYSETFETEIFSVETMAQISIVCPDPYLRDEAATVYENGAGWTYRPFVYGGTAETGFELEIWFNAEAPVLTVDNGRTMVFNTENVEATDVLYINTNRGSRAVLKASAAIVNQAKTDIFAGGLGLTDVTERWAALDETGDATSMIAAMDQTSRWLELHSQNNSLRIYGADQISPIPAAIRVLKFTPTYWGI